MKKQAYLYVSSYKTSSSEFGLSGYLFNEENGELEFIETVEKETPFNVTHFDSKRGLLYALVEDENLPGLRGGGGGRIFVFRIDPVSGKLTKICVKETWCSNPSYLTLDQTSSYLVVSNHGSKSAVTKIGEDPYGNYYPMVEYDDAAVELFSVNEDGTVDKLLDVAKHSGCGPEKRQVFAHPHSAVMSPCGSLFAVCDKGNDTVRMYRIDREKNKFIQPEHIYKHSPASLPRYCLFHPNKPWFYHNNENNAVFYAFRYQKNGLLRPNGECSAMPEGAAMKESILEQQGLVMDHRGRFIYDVVRGPNLVAAFEVDQENGSVKPIQYRPVDGVWPRGCAISPNGRFLLVCCLGDEKIIEYAIAPEGSLQETGREYFNAGAAYMSFCELQVP